jgi:hypothetical protein
MIRLMISNGAREIDKKMLIFLEFPRRNTSDTLLVIEKLKIYRYLINDKQVRFEVLKVAFEDDCLLRCSTV